MAEEQIAAAMARARSALTRKPHAGLVEDSEATARWQGGLRTSVHSSTGFAAATDMPAEIGGEGTSITPGWLLRAGLASCAATRIAMAAAAEGITLNLLEVRATSRSDVRGMLAVPAPDGQPVPAGPLAVALHVRIGAAGVAADRLRALVAATPSCSPMTGALERAVPVVMHVDVNP